MFSISKKITLREFQSLRHHHKEKPGIAPSMCALLQPCGLCPQSSFKKSSLYGSLPKNIIGSSMREYYEKTKYEKRSSVNRPTGLSLEVQQAFLKKANWSSMRRTTGLMSPIPKVNGYNLNVTQPTRLVDIYNLSMSRLYQIWYYKLDCFFN